MRRIISAMLFLSICFIAVPAYSKGPPPLFDKPVKLDGSGRPLYNSWERMEYERKQRLRRKTLNKNNNAVSSKKPTKKVDVKTAISGGQSVSKHDDTQGDPSGIPTSSSAAVPSPSNSIINRPVQIKGDPEKEDYNF